MKGIEGREAPGWDDVLWVQLDDGNTSLNVSDFKGKVLYLYCFQSWCPGCHSRGFPTLKQVIEHFEGDPDVAAATIQTVFEGFNVNTVNAALETARKYALEIPVGHSGSRTNRSGIMAGYRTGGTPWTIIIDRDGKVRYNDFHIDAKQAIDLIEKLKKSGSAPAEKDADPAD